MTEVLGIDVEKRARQFGMAAVGLGGAALAQFLYNDIGQQLKDDFIETMAVQIDEAMNE